jgi:hypothetical protein
LVLTCRSENTTQLLADSRPGTCGSGANRALLLLLLLGVVVVVVVVVLVVAAAEVVLPACCAAVAAVMDSCRHAEQPEVWWG